LFSSTAIPLDRSPIIIVGAGVIGLGVAWRAAARGLPVRVLERSAVPAGASVSAAGMLAAHAEIALDERALIELAEFSSGLWPDFVAELEEASDRDVEYEACGSLIVALDRDDAERLQHLLRYMHARSFPVRWMHADAAREEEPLLSSHTTGAVLCPRDDRINPRALVSALYEAALRAGAQIDVETEVSRVEISAGAVTGVVLADGSVIESERVVIAAGAWSPQIEGLGAMQPRIRPVKGQILALAPSPSVGAPALRRVVRGPDAYLVPRRDGRLIVGATSEERGFDTQMTAGGVFELLRGAYEVAPYIYELDLVDMWTGHRPASRDNAPILGGCDIDGLFFCTGHYRNGIQQAPASVALMSALLAGEAPALALAPFLSNRFSRA